MADEKVCIAGMGYVGLTLSVVLAESGCEVLGVDVNQEVVDRLNRGEPHFFEERLQVRLKQQIRTGTLKVQGTMPIGETDVFIISVGTPLVPGKRIPNLSHIDGVVEDVGRSLKNEALICMRSTLPVGLTRTKVIPTLERLSGLQAGVDFNVAFAPERTIEGKALTELRQNTQIVGGLTAECAKRAMAFFNRLTPTVVRLSSLEAAELVKLVDNSYRDVRFAFANELGLIAEALGLDATEVIQAANVHYPRNNIPVPSPGVGGACLSKDPHILVDVARKVGCEPRLVPHGRLVNESIPHLIVERLEREMAALGKNLREAKVLIVGFAFKGEPETTDLRDSTTLQLLDAMGGTVGEVLGYDPVVPASELEKHGVRAVTLPEGMDGVDVVVVANNHRSYLNWDLYELAERLRRPAIVYDAWRMFDRSVVSSINGLRYMGVGV